MTETTTEQTAPEAPETAARPRVQILHSRHPDYSCSLTVFVDGVRVDSYEEDDIDPGAGYEKEDYEERLESAREAAERPDANDFDRHVLAELEGMREQFRKYSYDKDW